MELTVGHPMWPIHRTSYPLCQPPQQAKMHLGQCARCGTYHTAPSGLSLPALVAVAALVVVVVAVAVAVEAHFDGRLAAAFAPQYPP